MLFWGAFSGKCVIPEGVAKEPPKIMKITKCLDSIDFTMVLTISICKFDATYTPDVFKHIPDLLSKVFILKLKGNKV